MNVSTETKRLEIQVPHHGDVMLWDCNQRTVHCAACGVALAPGTGVIFRKARFGEQKGGYFCEKDIAALLRKHTWHYNWYTEVLFPALELYTEHPLDGVTLAQAWEERGLDGLREALKCS